MLHKRLRITFFALLAFTGLPLLAQAGEVAFFFAPEWKDKTAQAKEITDSLSKSSGLDIKPRIATSYPQIIEAFTTTNPTVVYVGSFVQAVLHARNLSTPIAQGVNGKEMYSAVLIAPKEAPDDPIAVVKAAGKDISYAKAASSGESGAKAASGGLAEIGTNNHGASLNAVKAGKAKAAFVKNWWWDDNKDKFPELKKLDYPGISDQKNPDNVVSASKAVTAEDIGKITKEVSENAKIFGVNSFQLFNATQLQPTISVMEKGKIDPKNYVW